MIPVTLLQSFDWLSVLTKLIIVGFKPYGTTKGQKACAVAPNRVLNPSAFYSLIYCRIYCKTTQQ